MKIGGCIVLPIKYNQTWARKFDMGMGFFGVLLEALASVGFKPTEAGNFYQLERRTEFQ